MPPLPAPPCTTATRSAIVAGTVTGHHLLDVEGYSRTKELFSNGACTNSLPFTVGGRSWHISYYPNGRDPGSADFVSIFVSLEVDQLCPEPVAARVQFALLDRAGKAAPSHTLHALFRSTDGFCFGFPKFIKRADLENSEYLKDDRFTIRCDITTAKKLRKEWRRASSSRFLDVPPSDLHRHLGDLLASKEGADVTFHVAGETFQAHRSVLASRSPVFRAELFSPMMEGGGAAVVEIDDMDGQAFRALLEFVYTDALPEDMTPEEEAVMCQHLLVAADRYGMERLKLVCEDRLCRHVTVGSAATILALAEQHRCHGLKDACFRFLEPPAVLNAVAAAEGFEHLARSCPSVVKDLIFKITDC
jgi:speckle-type POZ protein